MLLFKVGASEEQEKSPFQSPPCCEVTPQGGHAHNLRSAAACATEPSNVFARSRSLRDVAGCLTFGGGFEAELLVDKISEENSNACNTVKQTFREPSVMSCRIQLLFCPSCLDACLPAIFPGRRIEAMNTIRMHEIKRDPLPETAVIRREAQQQQ